MGALRASVAGEQRQATGVGVADVRAGEETARQVLREEEAQAERLSALSRLVAAAGGLALALFWALAGGAPPGIELIAATLVVISLYALVLLALQWRRFRPWVGYVGLACDVLSLGTCLAVLSRWYIWPGGAASALHFPAWLFVVPIIAGNALSLRTGRIAAAGTLTVLMTLGLALFAYLDGARFGSVVADFSGPDLSILGIASRIITLVLLAEVLALLNVYFEAMLEILFKYDGTIIGFQGDGMLAAFGVPEVRPDDADRALQAALEMLAKAEELGAPNGRAPGLRIGVALHSGEVVAGNMGSRRRMEYTVLGDAVNTTARIEPLNKELGTRLLLSDATRARLAAANRLRPVGRFELRGRAQPVELYTIDSLVPATV